ncbi:hypothetical protein KVR01_013210 [Diaporthe batatas]|uniref:uncharacterized protein n=1 Tax=Diaporthe batatas TaxID=748121 RepID=UPI001D056FF9|nr:uncharacterized protein KVR01_013210 [Diaporthe batatas]KAG8156988.1 hypothetical protein KVR01_013210 [Diaporthe batatas]
MPIAAAQLTGTGVSVVLNDIHYFISPFTTQTISVQSTALSGVNSIYGYAPVTVVQDAVDEASLPELFANWTSTDDVFQDGFSPSVFLGGKAEATNGIAGSQILPLDSQNVPSGPYFLEIATGALHQAYRLYDDFSGAFTESLIQAPDGTFQALSARVASSATITIGVPSRLYYTKTAEKPLAGVRVGVKDIYKLAGVKSSLGNRAWYDLYPASNSTGTAVQRLIDAGAQIVGLQKASQFANGERATADWVDYHSPFNPRGDGYQDSSSSSAGAGSSIASYDWLDLALGTDTGGSIRDPAGVSGVFGNRPSHGLVPLDHVMSLSTRLDTAGFVTRDPYLWDEAQKVLYGENYTSLVGNEAVKYPSKIYTMEFFDANSSDGDAILVDFAERLARFVGGTVTALDLEAAWNESVPAEAQGQGVMEYMNTTYPILIGQEQVELVRDPFYADYAAAHDNRFPFVNPVPLSRWDWAEEQGADALSKAIESKSVFQEWFNSKILPASNDSAHCSSGILIYPRTWASRGTRDQYLTGSSLPLGLGTSRLSPFSGAPDSIFTLGEVSEFSGITQHQELFPVSVDVMVAKGCDGLLVRLAQDLVKEGILPLPKVGSSIKGGDAQSKRAVTRQRRQKVSKTTAVDWSQRLAALGPQ